MKNLDPLSVLLIGAGRMGGALLTGWLKKNIAPITIVEPAASNSLLKILDEQRNQVSRRNERPRWGWPNLVRSLADLTQLRFDVCVIAIKPQTLKVEAAILREVAESGALMISIAAGAHSHDLAQAWGGGTRIVRAMPNTPGKIERGITGLFAAQNTDEADRKLADRLLSALGKTVWVEEERQIDAVTAVSGSGPAYIFLVAEALTRAGVREGLPRKTAEKLARATVSGAGALLEDQKKRAASSLRKEVTSPGGTTEAALQVLMAKDHGLFDLMDSAVQAARKRAEELR